MEVVVVVLEVGLAPPLDWVVPVVVVVVVWAVVGGVSVVVCVLVVAVLGGGVGTEAEAAEVLKVVEVVLEDADPLPPQPASRIALRIITAVFFIGPR